MRFGIGIGIWDGVWRNSGFWIVIGIDFEKFGIRGGVSKIRDLGWILENSGIEIGIWDGVWKIRDLGL